MTGIIGSVWVSWERFDFGMVYCINLLNKSENGFFKGLKNVYILEHKKKDLRDHAENIKAMNVLNEFLTA